MVTEFGEFIGSEHTWEERVIEDVGDGDGELSHVN